MGESIDITFDFRNDTPPGKDPDALSPTLRRYHKRLWGRPLPGGKPFELDDSLSIRTRYLYHTSDLGEFRFSSDSVTPTFTRWKRMQHIVGQFPEEDNEAFRTIGYTIGAMMLWPSQSAKGLLSINGARGFNARIKDRMDLTLECIRRYYLAEQSPMTPVLEANADFFALFGDFRGFVQHYLLQDLVFDDFSGITFFTPFDDFESHLVPNDIESYQIYKRRTIEFIHARNQRILDLSKTLVDLRTSAARSPGA